MFSITRSLIRYIFLFFHFIPPWWNSEHLASFSTLHMLWEHLILNWHLINSQTMIFRLRSCFSLFPKPSSTGPKFYFGSYINFIHCSVLISGHISPTLQAIIRNLICVKHAVLICCRLTTLSFVKHRHFVFLQIWFSKLTSAQQRY